ncbi:hypothetical protein STEG23_037928 [Scotinomys teguina]
MSPLDPAVTEKNSDIMKFAGKCKELENIILSEVTQTQKDKHGCHSRGTSSRPLERSSDDVDIIFTRLKEVKAFERFHPNLLHQICLCGYYENLEKGITLFRQGDIGTNWYAVLAGSLDVKVSETSSHQDAVTICTLGIGTAFGESILDNTPRHATIVTRESSELLRIEQEDFKALWEVTPVKRLFDPKGGHDP